MLHPIKIIGFPGLHEPLLSLISLMNASVMSRLNLPITGPTPYAKNVVSTVLQFWSNVHSVWYEVSPLSTTSSTTQLFKCTFASTFQTSSFVPKQATVGTSQTFGSTEMKWTGWICNNHRQRLSVIFCTARLLIFESALRCLLAFQQFTPAVVNFFCPMDHLFLKNLMDHLLCWHLMNN